MKYAAEQHLRASGVSWTIVRATAFLELWIDVLTKTAARSGRPVIFGHGNNPVNFVSVTDVAALVEQAITSPAVRGRILEIGGPADLTFNQLAAAFQAAAGRTATPRHVPPPILRLMASTLGRVKPELGAPGGRRARHGPRRPHPRRDQHPPGLPRPSLHSPARLPPAITTSRAPG